MGLKSAYLGLYNASLSAGWAYVFYLAVLALQSGGVGAVYKAVELPLKVVQTAAIMEILHAIVGLVRSPVMVTATQVASRIAVLWGVCHSVPSVTLKTLVLFSAGGVDIGFNVFTLLCAWCASEVIRYSFFAFKEAGMQPYVLLWLRYTGFICLYPVGVASELALTYMALPAIKATSMYNFPMPNAINFAFDYHAFLVGGIVLGYGPGFPSLYMYMLSQRKRQLGAGKAKKA